MKSIFKGIPFDIGPLYAATDEAQAKINRCPRCMGTGTEHFIDAFGQAGEAKCGLCDGTGRKTSSTATTSTGETDG